MMGFIETPRKPWWDSGSGKGGPQNVLLLLFTGILLINGMAFVFLPFGAFLSPSLGFLFLILVVLPLVFFGIYLIPKFGWGIFLASLLSLLTAGASIFLVSTWFGLETGSIIARDILVSQSTEYSGRKLILYRKPILATQPRIRILLPPQTEGRNQTRGSEPRPGKEILLIPILDSPRTEEKENLDKNLSPISAWAVVFPGKEGEEGDWESDEIRGGWQVQDPARSDLLTSIRRNLPPEYSQISSPVLVYWQKKPEVRIRKLAIFGCFVILFANLIWIGVILNRIRKYRKNK